MVQDGETIDVFCYVVDKSAGKRSGRHRTGLRRVALPCTATVARLKEDPGLKLGEDARRCES
ncbi:hypothetical protein DIPPA_01163 [Diplonema papillatum]|nr:hypothetical protein DIPPA_01163 [Diplonema papillatum]